MTRYSACIEWLFASEHPDVADRIRAAKAAGLEAVEFWRWSNKNADAVRGALDETGLPLAGILCEPITRITDAGTHAAFLQGVQESLLAAQSLGASLLIAQAGDDRPGVPRQTQHAALVKVLREAADVLKGSGVAIGLEPLNDRRDHPGYYLTSTVEGLDIIDEVDRAEIRLVYDIYHSAMMGEHTEDVLEGRLDRIAHVHLADTQARAEPGNSSFDWRSRVDWLEEHGYEGFVGLEYKPSTDTLATLSFRG